MMETKVSSKTKGNKIASVPENWSIKEIKDLGKVITGSTPSTKNKKYYGGSYMFVRPADITDTKYVKKTEIYLTEDGLKVSRVLPKNTVLVGCIGTIGKTAMTKVERCSTNQQINAIIPNSTINPHFLYYSIKFNAKRLKSLAGGVTVPIINKSNFQKFRIPVPPLSEQYNIAYILSTVQEAIEKTDAVIKATKELKKSLMKHLFTYGPVPITEKEQVKLKETEIGLVPEEWEIVELNKVLEFTQYGLSDRAQKEGTYPILRMNNLNDGDIDIRDLKYLELDEDTYKKFKVNKGDLLFNRTNSIDLVGKTSVFNIDLECVFASYLIRLKVDKKQVIPEFLNYYLNVSSTQLRLKALATRGVSQSNQFQN
ncbi:MAG: restriction endonuclease subunit S [Candidatus Heimdallarchaeaceae archaeon]